MNFVNQSQFTMNRIPVHVVLVIDKHKPETDQLFRQTCARTFHIEMLFFFLTIYYT